MAPRILRDLARIDLCLRMALQACCGTTNRIPPWSPVIQPRPWVASRPDGLNSGPLCPDFDLRGATVDRRRHSCQLPVQPSHAPATVFSGLGPLRRGSKPAGTRTPAAPTTRTTRLGEIPKTRPTHQKTLSAATTAPKWNFVGSAFLLPPPDSRSVLRKAPSRIGDESERAGV